jgi:hypothetical protein
MEVLLAGVAVLRLGLVQQDYRLHFAGGVAIGLVVATARPRVAAGAASSAVSIAGTGNGAGVGLVGKTSWQL